MHECREEATMTTTTPQAQTQTRDIPLESVIVDKRNQVRITGVADETIWQYMESMKDGATFPPIVVYEIAPSKYMLADGFHRVTANRNLGRETIPATIHQGTEEDALYYSRFTANRTNGLRLTRSDLQALCETIIQDPEYRDRTDMELGKLVGCADTTIANARKRLGIYPQVKVGRDGRVWEVTGRGEDTPTTLHRNLPPEAPECPEDARETLAGKVIQRIDDHLDDIEECLRKLQECQRTSTEAERVATHARVLQGIAEVLGAKTRQSVQGHGDRQ